MTAAPIRALPALLVVLAAGVALGSLAQEVGEEDLLQRPAVEDALRAGGHAFEALPEHPGGEDSWEGQAPIDRIRLGGPTTLAYLSGQGLTLATWFAGAKMPLERVNRWNRENRFARVYRRPDGHPVIVAALPIPLASRGALAEFFRVYRGTLERFATEAGADVGPGEPRR